jgi:hypothetical protein
MKVQKAWAKRFTRRLNVFSWFLFGIVALTLVHAMLYSPAYTFPKSAPFSGPVWYNPYQDLDGADWQLGNFQVQSEAWGGITNGRNNTPQRIFDVYAELGYDIITISDYMSINPFTTPDRPLVRVYEHGYGAFKTHQVCLGSASVVALDYPLLQTRHNKQHILRRLSQTSKAVAIAHPSLRNAYSMEDMAQLTDYQLVEASSKFRMSMPHWDAALSAGKPVFILSNDDAHDLDKPWEYGRNATMVHTASLQEEAVIDALVAGRAYAFLPGTGENATHEQKVAHLSKRSELRRCHVSGDTLSIEASLPIRNARFIGQGGDTLQAEVWRDGQERIAFALAPEHTYVRAEVELTNGDVYMLNPVFRTEHGVPPAPAVATVNLPLTWAIRIGFSLLYLLPFVVLVRKMRRVGPALSRRKPVTRIGA